MSVQTQIIGKTSAIKGGLFRIKQRLGLLGFTVRHPQANRIIAKNGISYVYNPDEWSEYEIFLDLGESIRDSHLHIVSNDIGGIVGREATFSIVLAMAYGKPVIITHKPYFRRNVDSRWLELIMRNSKRINFQNLLKLNNSELRPYIEQVAAQHPHYDLTASEKTAIKRAARDLLRHALAASYPIAH